MKERIIVLCTGNSCRSIMAEALLGHLVGGRFEVLSAGSAPANYVHPKAISTLKDNSIPLREFRSKSWDEFLDQYFDFVLTVCDSASKESCPYFAGQAKRIHWSIPDPAQAKGSNAEIDAEFQQTFDILKSNIEREFL